MRVQLQGQHLRLRLQEAELHSLLDGGTVENRTVLPDGHTFVQQVRLADAVAWHAEGLTWRIDLHAAAVRAYSARLPTRDGIHVSIVTPEQVMLEVQFDVDVRDSTRQRMPKKPPRSPQ